MKGKLTCHLIKKYHIIENAPIQLDWEEYCSKSLMEYQLILNNCSDDETVFLKFGEQVKEYKNNFMKYSLEGISINKIRLLMNELQEVNQIDDEINPQNKKADQNAEVWRYLISTDEQLYFKFLIRLII